MYTGYSQYTAAGNTSPINTRDELIRFLSAPGQPALPAGDHELAQVAAAVVKARQYGRKGRIDSADAWYTKALDLLAGEKDELSEAYINYAYGRYLYEQNKKLKGLGHLLFARELLQQQPVRKIGDYGSVLGFLGRVYADYAEFSLAKTYLEDALAYPFESLKDEYYTYGMLGLVFYKLNQAQPSIRASRRALELAQVMADPVEVADMSGNLGACFMLAGQSDSALAYLEKDGRYNLHYGNLAGAAGSLILQTNIRLQQHNLSAVTLLFERVDSIQRVCSCFSDPMKLNYYTYRSAYNRMKGDYKTAVNLQDSISKYQDLVNNSRNKSIFRNLELDIVKKNNETKLALLQSERKVGRLTRNLLIIFLIFLVSTFLQFFLRLRQKQRNDKQLYEVQLQNAREQLESYLHNIREKNRLLETLTREVEEHREKDRSLLQPDETKNAEEEQYETLAKIRNASLITEDGWVKFAELVESVHKHFFVKLKDKAPGLTPGEVRLATLIKLNFSNKEMASVLGISPESVTKARQRLKKRLGDAYNSIEELVQAI